MQLCFDFDFRKATPATPVNPRALRGVMAWHSGHAAEEAVARQYQRAGARLRARRWRCKAGEIDLVMQEGDTIVFVEVKKAASFERAIERVTRRQLARIFLSGEVFLGGEPRGQLTDVRIDVALVNEIGEIKLVSDVALDH